MTCLPRPGNAAHRYADGGWPVFPCRPGSKLPATEHGFLDATTGHRQISRWWSAQPDANVAIATGDPGPDVLDVDLKAGRSGFAALNQAKHAGLVDGARAVVAHHPAVRTFTTAAPHSAAAPSPSRRWTSAAAAGMWSPRRPGPPSADAVTRSSRTRPALPPSTGPPSASSWPPSISHLPGCRSGRTGPGVSATWPRGWPGSRKATATARCSGPLPELARQATTPRWPPSPKPPATPGSATAR